MRNRLRQALRAVITSTSVADRRQPAKTTPAMRQVDGVIQRVDPVSRELPVLVGDVTMTFYVPLDCSIAVANERVKMRQLQEHDHASVCYWVEHGVTIAQSVIVR